MQDFPEHIGSLAPIESGKTPNWVADASNSTWQPEAQVRKPYESAESTPDLRPLDEQIIPKVFPLPPYFKQPMPEIRPDDRQLPSQIYEAPVKVPPVGRQGNQVLIPTFSLGDSDLSDKNPVKVQPYDINSPEAQLYLRSRDSIVKITTDKVDSEGKSHNAYGSGFFVTENGQIATAHHVVDGATSIKVTTAAGQVYNARVRATNVGGETAVIELTDMAAGEKFKPLPLRDSAADIESGEKLMTIGHPNGVEDIVMSPGAMIKRERFGASFFEYPKVNHNAMFIHASTRVQGGNSGGPLIDSEGRAVGLVNFRQPSDASGEFAGIDEVRSLIADPEKGQLSDRRSFFLPSTLQADRDVFYRGAATLFTGANSMMSYSLRNSTSHWGRGVNNGYSVLTGIYSIHEIPEDLKAFKTAIDFGTTAEKVSTGIDLGGDALMLAGSVAAYASKRYAALGNAISCIGATSRFGNVLFADRRYR